VHEKERRNWPRRFRTEIWTMKTLDPISSLSLLSLVSNVTRYIVHSRFNCPPHYSFIEVR
jgi:hypothetical protein